MKWLFIVVWVTGYVVFWLGFCIFRFGLLYGYFRSVRILGLIVLEVIWLLLLFGFSLVGALF